METVRFKPWSEFAEEAVRLFDVHRAIIVSLAPEAAVEHVGGTSVPGIRTKGDLDIAVRVAAEEFGVTDAALAARFMRNLGNERTERFASFDSPGHPLPVGIQLVAIGLETDVFVRGRDRLRASPELAAEYDQLKARVEGESMADYRAAKERFFLSVLSQYSFKLGSEARRL